MPYKFNPFTANFDKVNTPLINPLLFKGSITVAGDFPTSDDVETGWFYRVLADVTDNDVTKTNTGQEFRESDEIAWNGTDWSIIGRGTAIVEDGTAQGQITFYNITDNKWAHTEVSEAFWDDVNKRLGVNQAAPETTLHVGGTIKTDEHIYISESKKLYFDRDEP